MLGVLGYFMNVRENKKQDDTVSISKQDMAQLMYVFSHDLRNPLINMNALLSDMQLSLADAGNDSTAICHVVQDDLPDSFEMMADVISHMNDLVSGANDIYHCMFDDLEPEYIELSELVERLLVRQQGILKDKKISISARELSTVWADPLAMERIVSALLDNALHFTATGGHISLHTEKRSSLDVLVVRDSGVGMSENDSERVFHAFFSTDRKRAGMGLAVVKSLVQAHGGQVWCESTVGVGSIFYIALPNQAIDK